MRAVRLLFRIFGWLLTPFLAWAASFFGAVGGAVLALRMDDPIAGLAVTAVCGGLAGFTLIVLWLRYLRGSPEVREVLAVTEDGTPDTAEIAAPPSASPAPPMADPARARAVPTSQPG